jgi:SpoVK/Ycf46/Vps4 family AAA+-type ATPase
MVCHISAYGIITDPLAGAPGLGKTTTAECIAEMIQRPLYSITAGALGTTATDIESRLASHLHLATKWGCVVLLDEADLFLSARNRNDLGRNGVVILFLRLMDYYPGILVLTTNRVGTLDEGVLSRINIPLFCKSTLQHRFIIRTQLC